MKNFNLFKSNVSGMDREWIENGSGLTRHHGKLWKHVAMIFAVLVMSVANVGMAWAANGDVLFNQGFGSATEVAYSANTARSYSTSSTLSGLVGTGDNLFQGAQCNAKDKCGIAINTTSGANSYTTAGTFQAYANNTSFKWALYKTTNFATTAPTAIKFEMDVTPKYIDNKQALAVVVGSGFSVGTSKPEWTAGYTGFNIITNSTSTGKIYIGKVGGTTSIQTTTGMTSGTNYHITWVINATGDDLTYTGPDSKSYTLATAKWDMWVGTTRIISGQDRTKTGSSDFSGTTMQNLYIGNDVTGKHEVIIDNVKVTDLTPDPCDAADLTASNITSNGNQEAGTGITFSKVGSPASGDTWYWQTSATGTDKTYNATSPYTTATTAGSYTVYLRAYNTAGNCWGTAASMTNTIYPAPSAMIHNTFVVNDAWGSTIATQDKTNITGLSAMAAVGESVGTGSNKESLTQKIPSQSSEDAGKYMSLSFNVASGKQLNVTSVVFDEQPVNSTGTFKVSISDNQGSATKTQTIAGGTAGSKHTLTLDGDIVGSFKGTVTVKVWAYGWSDGYRFGDYFYINGTVTAAASSCSDDTGLAYGETTVNKVYGDASFTNTLTNSNSLSVTYSSSNTNVATVNESTGAVTIAGAGTTTITATWAGNASYCEDEVTYTLNVKPNAGSVTGDWDRFGGETIALSVSPSGGSSYTYQWQKWYNSQWNNVSNGTVDGSTTSGATTNNLQITNCSKENSGSYRCQVTSASQTNETGGYQVKVYVLECYNGGTTVYNFTRDGENQRGSVTIDLAASTGYTFKVHADNDYYGNDGTINSDATNWVLCNNSTSACTTNLTVNSGLGGTFTFTMEYSTGGNSSVEGEPEISVTYPRKRIYLDPGVWDADGAKFAYNYWREGVSAQWTDFLTEDDCGMYADIPQWNEVKMIAVRLKSSTVTPGSWDDAWNQTSDLTVTSNDYIVVSNWDNITYNSTYSTPTYTISYNAGTGGSGSKASESKTCGVDFTLPNSAVFTRTGYTQTGWTTSDGGAQEYALGGTYTTNEDKTFYPVWTVNNYDLTWNLDGGTTTSAGTGIGSGISSNTTTSQAFGTALSAPTVTKTGYNFSAWDPAVASTMPAANTTYTATWSSTAPTISSQPSDVNCNVGDGRSISVTASISTGGTPTYQWQVSDNGSDWANVASSGTSASYTVPTASAGTKYYRCVVTNPNGSATTTSDAATVTVTAAAGTTYYLVTSTAQLNNTDTYVIMDDGKAAMMGVASGSNPYLNAITSGFTVAGDKSTVTVTSSDVNTLKLKAESTAWNLFGKDSHYITTNSTVSSNLYGNATTGSSTDDFVFSFADGKATIKRNTTTNYHIYYDATNTKFIQSETATNIRLYTSNSTPVYTVTYDLNGGTGTVPTHRAEKSGTSITLASSEGLTKGGFTFDGWLCSVNSTKYAAGASYTMTAVNTTFTAQWVEAAAPTLYTVTFNSNGGSAVSPIEQASEGASITMPTAPTYTGHTFQGWVIGGTTKAVGASYTPAANVTAYATWKANCAGGGGSGSTEVYNGENVAKGNTTASGWTINNSSDMTLTSGSSNGYSYWYQAGSSTSYVQFDGSASLVAGDQIKIQWTHTNGSDKTLNLAINGSSASLTSGGTTKNSVKVEAVYDVTSATTVTSIKLKSSGSSGCIIYQVTIVKASGGGCCYVTYNGNGAQSGCISDKTAYTAGEGDVTILGNTGVSAYVKLGYRFNGWNTAANGSGMAYAAGDVVENISNDLTLHAQWVLDACSAPAAPTISGTASRTVGQTISLTATCASGADGSTMYTWYKGVDWGSKSQVQAAMTAGAGGRTFTKASCVTDDAGKYWCEASNGSGCEAHNETGFTVTVSAAVEEHIYYYKDANHYSEGTYSNPEGNTATSGDNKSLSSPWMICNGCKVGVDSVVAHGATYDGKGNHMNAYIKLPTGGNATTKNIKFALTEGYTGTLTMKIGGYESNPTVTLQPLVAGVLGDAISYSGTVSGVATTENNFGEITWNLTTPGGTYVLTVTTKTGYISQIDMTTETSAKFNVTYNGNGSTDGSVPSDVTKYAANASVTVQAQGTMEKANYTFGGWNTANNGTGTNYVAGSGTFNITGATTLYAHWTQTINLAPGAKGTGSLGATVSWNGTAVRGFTAHTAAGYSLTGYYTDPSGGTKVLNADGSFAATNIDGFITDGKWSRTGAAATLYAQWSGSAIVTNTLGVGSSSKWKSTISTTAPLQITSLSALAAVGGLTIVDEKGTSASGRALTCRVEASGATTKTDGKYLQLSFSIAAGYKLRVTGLDVTVRSVSSAGKYHLELEGTTGSLIPDDEQVASGAVNTIFDDAYNVELTGNVTLKLWAYGADSDNKMSYYRLGSPIAIYGAVEETCTPPTFSGLDYSATEYTQGDPASAISVTGEENVDSYQWKYSTVNDRTSGTNCGTGSSVTPATDASATTDGTRYYWCELKNGCTTVKTSTVAVTVSASASNPTVTWSSVSPATVNYGGGNYTLRATVNETGWSGTLESSMITAPAGIYIHNIGTGTEADKEYIEFQFDVTTAFDREANETIGFHLSLPAISGWNALTSDKQVEYEACDEGAGVGGMIYLPVKSTQTTAASGMRYYWESTGSGRLASQYGGSAMGAANNPSGYKTADSTFYYYAASTGDKWMFQTYVGGVNKIRVVFRAAGALKSSNLTISKFCYDTEYFSSQGDRQVSIGEVSPSKASFASGEDGYMEFTVPEMAANSYAYFQTGSSNIKIYGIVLYSESSGSGGSVETDPTWSGGLNKDGSSVVDKNQGDANFTYTISTTTNTLGGITYSSSNSSVAEVNATTGEVRITATGESTQTAVITATLARSGCYQPATRTYTVRVAGQECTITSAGTLTADKTSKCESDNVVLSLSGHDTDGTTVTWYRDETDVTSSVLNNTLTTSTRGAYSVVVSKSGCSLRSNTVNITNISAATSATKIVDRWYVKNGRLTPDIALWRLDEGTTFAGVSWSPSNSTGLDFVIRDGIVYLEGKEPSANETGADKVYTLTLTIDDACGTPHALTDKTITLTHQKNTDKHVLAFVVTGKQNGGFTESIPASQTTSVDLYNEIAKNFDVLATNIYATDDEQKIKEYYSQFDIICITDYPNTKTKGTHSVSYSDAIGVMVDIRPVLTMEAWVSGLSNWNKKGISGDPKSPSTRQYTMLLQCKDHEIFAGTTLTEVGEGDEKMYRIHMVDETLHPYDTLDANYGSGTHESKKGYRYGSYPALQGFTFSQAMLDADLLPLGLIDDGAGNDLQVGLERQREMSARMMVLGINSTAMERLTDDGERIVINALKYLMKKNAEEIADCSTSFVGGAEGDADNWMNADNWTGNTIPDKTQKVRILAPCTVPAGEKVHVAGVLIAPNDGGTYNGGSTPTSGSLTIAAGGALIVDGKVESVTAPAYNRPRATTPADLTILSSSEAQGALIFDNSEGETQATVVVHSSANKDEGTRNWQYLTSPLQETPVTEFFYGVGTYTYKHSEADGGWVRYNLGTTFHAFDAIGLTQEAAKDFVFYGPLAPTGEWNLSLTHAYSGNNLFGNSWTAPIDLKALVRNTDFDGNIDLDLAIYNTGSDRKNGAGEFDQAANADNTPGTWHHVPLLLATFDGGGWEGMTVIPAYQAFQLKATAAATLTIDYDKCVRGSESKNYTEPLRAPRRRSAGRPDSEIEALRLAVSDANGVAYIYLLEGEQFTEGYDNGWELSYTANSKYGKLYAISPEQGDMMALARPSLEGTMIGFQPGESSEYTITFNETDGYYYLNDLKMEQSTLIQAGESYTFSVEEGESANRFLISSVPFNKPGIVTGVTNPNAEAPKAQKVIYNDKLYIIRGGKVFSADGQLVK